MCVRTSLAATPTTSQSNARFIVEAGTESVFDQVTGLTWQRFVPMAFDGGTGLVEEYSVAETYCSSLVLAGHEDWRLPIITELISLVSPIKSWPAIHSKSFPDTPSDLSGFYWTSTQGQSSVLYWWVEFAYGHWRRASAINSGAKVRCVR